ncbi:MAG: hypothetical protein Q8P99_00760 [bacterium]|nr:hypothetical protein [bacterium]
MSEEIPGRALMLTLHVWRWGNHGLAREFVRTYEFDSRKERLFDDGGHITGLTVPRRDLYEPPPPPRAP